MLEIRASQIDSRATSQGRQNNHNQLLAEIAQLTLSSERNETRLEKRLRLLNHLTSDWFGDKIGDGLLHVLNRDGRRPPLVWCFNAQAEPGVMSQGLGPDQPLIALRSLHLVEPLDATRYGADGDIAAIYTQRLLETGDLNLDGCVVGGNCQGAGVAAHIAANLVARGHRVGALIIMESASPLPFPGKVGMIYGARSEMFNPFLRGEAPEEKWKVLFSDPVCEIISGSHGEYFTEENSPALCRAVERIATSKPERGAFKTEFERLHLHLADPPTSLVAGQVVPLSIHVSFAHSGHGGGAKEENPFVLYHLWTSVEHGVSDRSGFQPLPIEPGDADSVLTLPFAVPAEVGRWELRLFPCRREGGPISWAENRVRRYAIKVFVDDSV